MTICRKFFYLLTSNQRRQLPLLLLMIFIGMALEMMGLGLVVPIIAIMTKPAMVHQFILDRPIFLILNQLTQVQLIIASMLGLVGLYFIKTLFLMMMLWKQNKFINSVQTTLSSRLFTIYLCQSWSFHLERNSARLINNVVSEVGIFIGSTLQPGLMLLTEGLVLLGVIALLLKVELLGSLIVVGVVGTVAWGFQYTTKNYIYRLGEARHFHEGARMQHLHQGLGGVKDVKLLGRETEFISQYNKTNKVCVVVAQKQKVLADLPRLWLEFLAVIALASLVLVMLGQKNSLDALLPTLGLFSAAAFRLLPSANRLLGALQSFRYSIPAINMLHDEFQCFGELPSQVDERILLPFQYTLMLDRITYQYQNADRNVLTDLTFSIPVGTSVGFIGASGAGKSTLVDIILGLLLPDSGSITVDGIDIQTNIRGWQDQIGYVPQSIFLTDDSLRRNVAFGIPDDQIDDIAVQRAIKAAQLDAFVGSLPEGLNTFVGERGVRLSGGQRQRIGIARALYHDPAVLVLDEATSALDMATEKEVMAAINALQGSKTIIIVAHRLSTVANCDILYKMAHGRIIEAGSFEKLAGASIVS